MVKSAQQYFEERQLYDISLLSTVGFDTDVAKQLSRREKVLDAQGAVSTDALLLDAQGKESALKVYSLLDQQNLPVLVSGRMPQNAQECVVDAQAFGKDAVGTMLTLSENNEEDTEELFAHKQFHVVGTVNSPYYANYERGTTSLGNGTIRGFMLVLKDAFDCDYDTEIFVRLNTEAAIYSEEYDAQIDEVESWLEDFAQQKADERYQRLKADGEEELYASRQQILSQTQKNQLELEASRQQLSRAEGTIADGKAQLEIGKSQLISGKAQLQAQRQQLLQQQAQLQAQRQQILQGLNQARTAKSQTAGNAYLAQANAQAQAQEQQLQASLTQVEGGLRQVESGLDQLEIAQSELELQEQQLQNSQTELEAAQREYDAGLLQYKEGSRRLSEGVDEANQQLDEAQDELDELEEPDVYLLGRDTNIGYASFDNDLHRQWNRQRFSHLLLSGRGAGLCHHHEPHGGGAAHPDRCAQGAGLQRGQHHGQIPVLLGQRSRIGLFDWIFWRLDFVPLRHLAGVCHHVSDGRHLLCVRPAAGTGISGSVDALLDGYHLPQLPV